MIHILSSNERKKLIEELKERFGITEIPATLIESGKGKIRGFTGDLADKDIGDLTRLVRVEFIGAYMFRYDLGLRMSMDACHFFKDQITKNIVEISEEEFYSWIRGGNLDIQKPQGVYVIKHGKDFVGCAYSNGRVLYNYVPKERHIKVKKSQSSV